MFEGFSDKRVATSRGQIALYQGGSGPPVLLLHGFPETRVAWYRVAPSLACRFTIVAADLPGYGDSAGPAATDDHAAHSKRAFAMTLFEAMRQLGFERFAVIGHDRGARVAYRLAIDAPGSVAALGVLDVVPSLDMATALTHDLAVEMANWFFLSQRSATAERLITCAGADYLDAILAAWAGRGDAITPEARREYARCFVRPEVIAAFCEEYRAGATIDLEHERADRARGHRIRCPTLALWSASGLTGRFFEPLIVWRRWAESVRGSALACGHFLMEEAPEEVTAHLSEFLGSSAKTSSDLLDR